MLEALGLTVGATTVYRAMLDHPDHGVAELAAHCGLSPSEVHAALDELGRRALVRASTERPGRVRAVGPEIGLADLIAEQEAELAERQAQLAVSKAAVTRLVADRAEQRSAYGERLLGTDAIVGRLERMSREAATEVLGCRSGVQRPEDLGAGRATDAELLARGVALRSLYPDAVRRQPPPSPSASSSSTAVRPSSRSTRKTPARAPCTSPSPASWAHCWTSSSSSGAPPSRSARSPLGISARTVGRHMASIMERLGATSRFEAGIKATQRGWI
ncbi:hypothetical protein [Kitasatospora sp. NRRL B-11411]|uniref:hypothetical protein n=1 Tax=Kitasatospora sp. NRRL B-11411 TaxID=1463822 RepID=UPI00068C7DDF|nr:hypothetical protein [Kitasatospora sp. NRRL B-11411]